MVHEVDEIDTMQQIQGIVIVCMERGSAIMRLHLWNRGIALISTGARSSSFNACSYTLMDNDLYVTEALEILYECNDLTKIFI